MANNLHIGLAGGGKTGSDLFGWFSSLGFAVTCFVRNQQKCETLHNKWEKKLNRQLAAGAITSEEYEWLLAQCRFTYEIGDLQPASLIIECVTEDKAAKQTFFEQLYSHAITPQVLASNSSSFSPSLLSSLHPKGTPVYGLHFFYPAAFHAFAELVVPRPGDAAGRELIESFASHCQLRLLQLPEQQASILNRIFLELQAGAYEFSITHGITPEQIDEFVQETLFPLGLFGSIESIGRPVLLESVKNYLPLSLNKVAVQRFYQYLQQDKKESHFFEKKDLLVQNSAYFRTVSANLRTILEECIATWGAEAGIDAETLHEAMADFTGLSRVRIFV